MANQINYQIQASNPQAHLWTVHCNISNPEPQGQRFSLPTWVPGSYKIRDFAKHILQLKAYVGEQEIPIQKINKSAWQLEPTSNPLKLVYQVYAWDLSVRGSHLDTTHGFFDGASVLMCVEGQTEHPCEIEILPPHGENYQNWKVATALPLKTAQRYGFGTYCAPNYAALIDHPVEMGDFTVIHFNAGEVPHDMVVTGVHEANVTRIQCDLSTLCTYQIQMFGQPPPFDYYLFMLHALGHSHYGGLEHRSSSALQCARDNLVVDDNGDAPDNYREFLSLCSHEYFHVWNIKRIKPAVFIPYQLQAESYTTLLWVFEGFTSYYEDLILVRTKLIEPQHFLNMFAQKMTRVLRLPGHRQQTLMDSSYDAWIKLYQPDDNTPNAVVSYYTKGAMLALLLDLHIRRLTAQQKSLDDVMVYLWQEYGQPNQGVGEDDMGRIIEAAVGISVESLLHTALHTTSELPLADYLNNVGIELRMRPQLSQTDKGGNPKSTTDQYPKSNIGIIAKGGTAGIKVQYVLTASSAEQAGIAPGDILIAMNGIKLQTSDWEQTFSALPASSIVTVHGFRRDELMQFEVVTQACIANTCDLILNTEVDDTISKQRNHWLHVNN